MINNIKKIGIIGGGGFIGQNLTQFFSERDYNVDVFRRNNSIVPFASEKVMFIAADVNATEELLEKVSDCDIIIWLVSATVPGSTLRSLTDDFNVNVSPLIKFMEGVGKLSSLKRFIFMSSGGTIYGDPIDRQPIKEEAVKKPISAYGLSKIQAEQYVRFLTENQQIQSFILRPSNVFGPFQNLIKPQGIIGYAFKSIINNTSMDLYDEGRVIRDFIYVTDLSAAIEKCLLSPVKPGSTSIYNVGSQQGYTIRQILEKIELIAGTQIKIVNKSSRSFDCKYNVLDIGQIEQELQWNPDTHIDDGLIKVWEWIKSTYQR